MRRNATTGIILATAMLAGCSSTGPFGRERLALPVGPSYVGGRGVQVYPTSETLLGNVKEAMADVGIHTIVQNQDPGGLIILEGRTADDRKARVTVEPSGTRATISTRIGWLGDEPLTRAFLDRVGTRQGTFAPAPAAQEEPKEADVPILSRKAVPDAVMLRNQLNEGYNPSPVP